MYSLVCNTAHIQIVGRWCMPGGRPPLSMFGSADFAAVFFFSHPAAVMLAYHPTSTPLGFSFFPNSQSQMADMFVFCFHDTIRDKLTRSVSEFKVLGLLQARCAPVGVRVGNCDETPCEGEYLKPRTVAPSSLYSTWGPGRKLR